MSSPPMAGNNRPRCYAAIVFILWREYRIASWRDTTLLLWQATYLGRMRDTSHFSNGCVNTLAYELQEPLKKSTCACHQQKRLSCSTSPGHNLLLTWIVGYG